MIDRIKTFWKEITGPDPEELEIQRLEKEREILWRKVDQLEAENQQLRDRFCELMEDVSNTRTRIQRLRTDVEHSALAYHRRVKSITGDLDGFLLESNDLFQETIKRRWGVAAKQTKD